MIPSNDGVDYIGGSPISGKWSKFSGTYNNYTDLITNNPASATGRFSFVENSQGTKWLPGTLGGTFYGAGWYYDTGTAWLNKNDEIFAFLEEPNFKTVKFDPLLTPPTHQEGLMYYDSNAKTHVLLNDKSDVALNVGEELWFRVLNNSGVDIFNGDVIFASGAAGPTPTIELAIASDLDQSIRTVGVATQDILNGEFGYVTRFGAVGSLNTLGFQVDDIIYLSPTVAGAWTTERPSAPNYIVRIGLIFIVDEFQGAMGVDILAFNGSDTTVNMEGFLNGIVTDTPEVVVSVSGGIIYADITNQTDPTENLNFLFDGVRYQLDTTTNTGAGGAARVIIPPGLSATLKTRSVVYIYLDGGVAKLATALTEPSGQYASICILVVFDDVRTLADGKPFSYRRNNNAIDNINGVNDGALGLGVEILNAIRLKLGSNWLSGQSGTPTVNDTTIKLALTAGRGMQFRRTTTPSFDGNSYLIYNDITNTATYEDSLNLTDITATSDGTTLLNNNRYYTIRLFYQLNSNGIGNNVIATRPSGFYITPDSAIQDAQNYATAVNDTDIEEVVYPLYDMVIGRTGGGGTIISLIDLVDRRTKLLGGSGGGGASSGLLQSVPYVDATRTFDWVASDTNYVALPFNRTNRELTPDIIKMNPVDDTQVIAEVVGYYKGSIFLEVDNPLTVQFFINGVANAETEREIFAGSTTVSFSGELQAGDYMQFMFKVASGTTTIQTFTNGYIERISD